MTGDHIARLRGATHGMNPDDIVTSSKHWRDGATALRGIANVLARAELDILAGFGPQSSVGPAASKAFSTMRTKVLEPRAAEMDGARDALDNVETAMLRARATSAQMPTSTPGPAPTMTGGTGDERDDITRMKIHAAQMRSHNQQVAAYGDSDEQARQEVIALNRDYDEAAAVMAKIHGEPTPTGPGRGPGSGPGSPGSPGTTPPMTAGGGSTGASTGGTYSVPTLSPDHHLDHDPEHDPDQGFTDPTTTGTDPTIVQTPTGSTTDQPTSPLGESVGSGSSSTSGTGPGLGALGGGAAAGALGGMGVKGLLGGRPGSAAITGTAGSAGAAGTRSLGAGGRAGSSGVLGRGAAAGGAAGGQPVSRGAGTAGATGRGAGAGTAGGRGAGAGTAGRGAGAGGRAGGIGGAGGRGGRTKDEQDPGRKSEYDVEEEWLDDEGSPGVLE